MKPTEQTSMQDFHPVLIKYLSTDQTLKDFLNHCEELLGYPIWIMDVAYNLVEASNQAAVIWDTYFSQNDQFTKMVASWKQEQFIESVSTARKPIFHLCQPINAQVIVSDISINQERIAKFTAFPAHPDTCDIGKIELVCTSISIMLQKLNFFAKKENFEVQFLNRLLQAPPLTENELTNFVVHGKLTLAKDYLFMLIYNSDDSSTTLSETMHFELRQLRSLLPNAFVTIEEDHFLVLLRGLPKQEQREAFLHYLEEQNQTAYISNSFTDLTQAVIYHRQAKTTMQICVREKSSSRLNYYHSIYLTDLLSQCGGNLYSICMPEVIAMVNYDKENATDYFHTCDVIFNQASTRLEAAQILNLHLNTIKYRLAQAEQLFGFRIDSYEQRVYFTISSEIIKLYL